MEAYKRASGRMFPTCSEILEVVKSIGYQKVCVASAHASAQAAEPATPAVASEPAISCA